MSGTAATRRREDLTFPIRYVCFFINVLYVVVRYGFAIMIFLLKRNRFISFSEAAVFGHSHFYHFCNIIKHIHDLTRIFSVLSSYNIGGSGSGVIDNN